MTGERLHVAHETHNQPQTEFNPGERRDTAESQTVASVEAQRREVESHEPSSERDSTCCRPSACRTGLGGSTDDPPSVRWPIHVGNRARATIHDLLRTKYTLRPRRSGGTEAAGDAPGVPQTARGAHAHASCPEGQCAQRQYRQPAKSRGVGPRFRQQRAAGYAGLFAAGATAELFRQVNALSESHDEKPRRVSARRGHLHANRIGTPP